MPINPTGLKALCWSLSYGADKIPDSWFEKVPGGYYKAKEDRERKDDKRESKGKSRRHSDDRRSRYASRSPSADGHHSEDYDNRGGRNRRMSYDAYDDYASNRGGRARRRSMGGERGGLDGSNSKRPSFGGPYKPYNPAEYGPVGNSEREEYYTGRPQQTAGNSAPYGPYAAAAGASAGVAAAAPYADGGRPESSGGPMNGYVPYSDIYAPQQQQSHPQQYGQSQQAYPPQQYQQPYSQPPDAYGAQRHDGNYSDSHSSGRSRRPRKDRDSSRSRQKSRPRSRSRARSSIRDRFDLSDKGVGYGTLGGLAGGLVGSEVGHGGILPTVAGAVIGALGANAFEKRDSQKRRDRNSGRGYDDGRRGGKRSSRAHDDDYSD